MENTILRLTELYRKLLNNVSTTFVRNLMHEINWNARLIGVKGSRGVGKTTLMLQYIKLNLISEINETLYVSLDSLVFAQNSLIELVDTFAKQGGKFLFLDEVHKYENWLQELKNIYDSYPELNVVFTGSSMLEILDVRADLSRRAVVYTMQGLSFREYIFLETNINIKPFLLSEILNHHEEITNDVLIKIKPLKYFNEYLKTGYYPFYKEEEDLYHQKIREITNMILEIELPLLRGLDISYVHRMKQLLYIIAQSVPFAPNVSKLSERIGIQRSTLLGYLHYLNEVKLTHNLFKEAGGISKLQKPLKVYLENTNLMYAISGENINEGNLRETFFANQLVNKHSLQYSDKGDFLVNEKYTFEIGGKNKESKQIKGIENGYIAADGIEYGYKNKIPLWLFGFLY